MQRLKSRAHVRTKFAFKRRHLQQCRRLWVKWKQRTCLIVIGRCLFALCPWAGDIRIRTLRSPEAARTELSKSKGDYKIAGPVTIASNDYGRRESGIHHSTSHPKMVSQTIRQCVSCASVRPLFLLDPPVESDLLTRWFPSQFSKWQDRALQQNLSKRDCRFCLSLL
jgi:hypothetical protein